MVKSSKDRDLKQWASNSRRPKHGHLGANVGRTKYKGALLILGNPNTDFMFHKYDPICMIVKQKVKIYSKMGTKINLEEWKKNHPNIYGSI